MLVISRSSLFSSVVFREVKEEENAEDTTLLAKRASADISALAGCHFEWPCTKCTILHFCFYLRSYRSKTWWHLKQVNGKRNHSLTLDATKTRSVRWTTKAEMRNCTLGLQALINSRAAAQFPRLSAVSVRKPYGLCLTFLAGGYGDCTAALKSHENRTVSSQLPYGLCRPTCFSTHPHPLVPPHCWLHQKYKKNLWPTYRTVPAANVHVNQA